MQYFESLICFWFHSQRSLYSHKQGKQNVSPHGCRIHRILNSTVLNSHANQNGFLGKAQSTDKSFNSRREA